MSVGKAGPSDFDEIWALCDAWLPGAWSRGSLLDELKRRESWVFWVKGAGGLAQGVLFARSVLDEVEILNVAVAPEARRSGVARRLLSAVFERAQKEGIRRFLLELRESNAPAYSLYESQGFVVVGRRSRYYPGGEDAVLMTLETSSQNARPAPVRADVEVLENSAEGGSNYRLVLAVPDWPDALPGQFLMLSAGARTEVERTDPLLPRPMAVFRQTELRPGHTQVEVLYKVTGRGSGLLSNAKPGERLRVVGPLGGSFSLPPAGERSILVGGGTGIASLYKLASDAGEKGPVDVVLGARTEVDLMGVSRFESLKGVTLHLTTEDGGCGHRGRVTDLLPDLMGTEPDAVSLYTCGPTPMMRACADLASQAGLTRCWVSLENTMACGFGVCLGCAIPVKEGGFSLLCRAGPVYSASEIQWEGLP